MALFGRRRAKELDDSDPTTNIVMLAQLRLSAHGVSTDVLDGTSGVDTVLVDDKGRQFPLRNVMAHLVPLSPETDEYHEYLMAHIDSTIEAMAEPPVSELSEEQWVERVRIRMLPIGAEEQIGASYAQRALPGIAVVLCIDNPASITYVSDADLEGRDVRASFDAGFRNVMAEPIEEHAEIAPGIHMLAGPSPFIATKAIGLGSLLGSVLPAAPHGVIVGMPHRHLLLVHAVTGAASVSAIGELATIVAQQATDDAPSGPLSRAVYFWKDDVFEEVGRPDDAGKIHIRPSERLMDILNAE